MKAQLAGVAGKVIMEDGSPPPKPALIVRNCGPGRTMIEATTDRNGVYFLRSSQFESIGEWGNRGSNALSMLKCTLRAELSGYRSGLLNLDDLQMAASRELPPLVLRKKGSLETEEIRAGVEPPRKARKSWDRGQAALRKGENEEAERQFRLTVQFAPDFAMAWNALGTALQNRQKWEEAREAYRKGAEADPKSLTSLVLRMQMEGAAKNWVGAAESAGELIARDTARRHPEAFVHRAAALYQLQRYDEAAADIAEALRLDSKQKIPGAEYLCGLILEARQDWSGAAEHFRRYLALEPNAANAPAVRRRLENPDREAAPPLPLPLEDVDLNVKAVQAVWVPGGRKALAAIAHADPSGSADHFFERYTEALVRFMEPSLRAGIPGYLDSLRAYFAALPELSRLGEPSEGKVQVRISLGTEQADAHAADVLKLLGWRARRAGEGWTVEYGDEEADVTRHPIAVALGIDAVEMKETLEAGRPFLFEILSEEAPLMGGNAWLDLLQERRSIAGGLAEAFCRDLRLAKTYAGLSRAGMDAAGALVSAFGLRRLAELHSGDLYRYGRRFRIQGGTVPVPGGPPAESVWAELAGASPGKPADFFHGLLTRDQGMPAEFFLAVSEAGEEPARYLTATAERARAFYKAHVRGRMTDRDYSAEEAARRFAAIRADSGGQLACPGGRESWPEIASGEESLFSSASAPQFLELSRLEGLRKSPLSRDMVRAIKDRWSEWRPLLPLLARLPSLGERELAALATFEEGLRGRTMEKREAVLGAWYALVELIALGAEAGSLSPSDAASGFRQACQRLSANGSLSAAIQLLGNLAGESGSPDAAVRDHLLRLAGEHRRRYDHVLALQHVPGLDAARTEKEILAALVGRVYAAWLDDRSLLVSQDPRLVAKHRFPGESLKEGGLFRPAELMRSSQGEGSRFSGGFMGFGELARSLAEPGGEAGEKEDVPAPESGPQPSAPVEDRNGSGSGRSDVFRADVRLVGIYATVVDERGRYVDDLPQGDFTVLEDGKGQPVAAFESHQSALTCALVLDTTLSMHKALPALKNAAIGLIERLRPVDQVAVYTFQNEVRQALPATTDRRSAKRAVAAAEANGETALFNALVRVTRLLAGQQGKKVIVLFTDGEDNRSTITADTAIRQARAAGIPVYAVAQGMALYNKKLMEELGTVSKSTGGLSFGIREPGEIESVFEAISKDLSHGYLLQFSPGPSADSAWRRLEVVLKNGRGFKVRAREGYFPE